MRYSGYRMRRSAVGDLFWSAALSVAAICLTVDVGFPETHCTVVRMDPDEVTIPAEGGDIDATLTISPVTDNDCELICLFSFKRPGFTLAGCPGLDRCRLDWAFPFKPTGNPNECTTSLTNPIPPNTGPPRMGTLYSFSGQDAELGDTSLALDTLVIRQEGDSLFSGCRIFPRNMHLMFHRPEFYLPAVAELVQLSPRSLSVSVVDAGQPVEGATVTMVSTQNAFPNGGVLPVSSQASGPTDASGLAKFRINPLGNEAFDQTDFTATTTINGETFTCDGTVVAGLGAALNAYAARVPEVLEMLEFSAEILGQVLAYLPERDAVSKEQLQKEIVTLLQREVIGKPAVYRRLRDRLRRHRPAIQAYLEGGAASLDGEATADVLATLRFLLDHGGPELRKVVVSAAAAAPMLFVQAGAAPEEPFPAEAEAPADGDVQAAFGRAPLAFEENVGQTHERIDYVARGPGYGVYLTSGEAILVRGGKARGQRGVVRMSVVGAGEDTPAIAEHPLLSKSHYLIGDDPANWHTDVPHAGRVRYRDVYPGIDLVYYGNRRRLEFDFDVAPGADPGQIKLVFPESSRVEIGEDGALLLASAAYTVKLGRPIIYQETDRGRREIAGGYRLGDDGSVGFRLGSYDPTQRLLIDPILARISILALAR